MGERQSFVKIEIDPATLQRVIQVLSVFPGGTSEERVMGQAATDTAKLAKEWLSSRTASVYEAPRAASVASRAKVQKGTIKHGATIFFRSDLPDIMKFKAQPRSVTPTMFSESGPKTVRVLHTRRDGTIFRTLGPQKRYSVWASQVKATGLRAIKRGFVTRFSTGHVGMAYRTKTETVNSVLGSTDRAMVRNEKVYDVEEPRIGETFLEKVEEHLQEVLAKQGG